MEYDICALIVLIHVPVLLFKQSLDFKTAVLQSYFKQTFFEKIKEEYTGKKTPQSLIIPTSGLNLTKLNVIYL